MTKTSLTIIRSPATLPALRLPREKLVTETKKVARLWLWACNACCRYKRGSALSTFNPALTPSVSSDKHESLRIFIWIWGKRAVDTSLNNHGNIRFSIGLYTGFCFLGWLWEQPNLLIKAIEPRVCAMPFPATCPYVTGYRRYQQDWTWWNAKDCANYRTMSKTTILSALSYISRKTRSLRINLSLQPTTLNRTAASSQTAHCWTRRWLLVHGFDARKHSALPWLHFDRCVLSCRWLKQSMQWHA